jgi:hypothetical protein
MVIIFSLITVSCVGEEPNVSDDELFVDETTDESPDEVTDEVEIDNETKDENVDEAETDIEIEEENDSDIDEIIYTELQNLEECENSSCSEICFLVWDEGNKEKVEWYYLEKEEVEEKHISFKLESTSNGKCFSNAKDPDMFVGAIWDRLEAYNLPIRNEQKYSDSSYSYYFLSDTNETWQGKKKISFEAYTSCIRNGEDICKKYGAERVHLEGLEGEFMSTFDEPVEFVPLPK